MLLNEINTMPGFTKISMFPKLWIESGVSYEDMVNELLDLAVKRYDFRVAPIITNATEVLEKDEAL